LALQEGKEREMRFTFMMGVWVFAAGLAVFLSWLFWEPLLAVAGMVLALAFRMETLDQRNRAGGPESPSGGQEGV